MANLTKAKVLRFESGIEPIFNTLPIKASTKIFQGSALTSAVGFVEPGLAAATAFAGFAEEDVDNSAGTAGAKSVRVRSRGAVQLAVTGVVAASVLGAVVYLGADDQTFTLTDSTGVAVGKLRRYISDGVAMVYFEGSDIRLGIAATEV